MLQTVSHAPYSINFIFNQLKNLSEDKRAEIMLAAFNNNSDSLKYIRDQLNDLSEENRNIIIKAYTEKYSSAIRQSIICSSSIKTKYF